MSRLHIPGAVILIVRDGAIFFIKGYGFADLENRTPVIPEKTLFNVSSTSKSFTATAVMQQVERGRLDLNTDVNTYLKSFQLPATFPEPVTLAHLLTHTAGFDERGIGTSASISVAGQRARSLRRRRIDRRAFFD
jgi:CubicO group peptidase (beta-lactamase class C family)